MRVQFRATFNELMDAHMRTERKIRNPWAVFWNSAVWAALGLAVFAYAVQKNADGRLLRSIVASLSVTVVYFTYAAWTYKGRVRAFLKKYYGSDDPFDVVFELKSEGLRVSQMETTTTYAWSAVKRIEETAGDVAIHLRPTCVVVVRVRAFESPEARKQFMTLARQYRDNALTN